MLTQLPTYVFQVLMLSTIYSLVAIGFTLYFGVLNIINFAHGAVVVCGAFTVAAVLNLLAPASALGAIIGLILCIFFGLLVTGAVGVLTAKFVILPLHKSEPFVTLLATLMLAGVIREGIRVFYPNGSEPHGIPSVLPRHVLNIFGAQMQTGALLLLGFGILCIFLFELLVNKTRLGRAMRAVSQDEEIAKLMGVNFRGTIYKTFILGSFLAFVGGAVTSLYYGVITFDMGLNLGLIGFAAAVFGGLSSIYGAIIGSVVFAVAKTFGSVGLPALVPGLGSAYDDVFAFACVIIAMIFFPTGIIVEKRSSRV